MDTKQQLELPPVQAAIYRVALSLDAFLLNGIQYGVLPRTAIDGFLHKTANNLLRDLEGLEQHAPDAPTTEQPKVQDLLIALRGRCQQIIHVATKLNSFRTFSLQQLHSTVSEIPRLRAECAQLIQELEGCYRIAKPFYQSRPEYLTALFDHYLANLEQRFAEELAASSTAGQ
jgi:hypothetical protein